MVTALATINLSKLAREFIWKAKIVDCRRSSATRCLGIDERAAAKRPAGGAAGRRRAALTRVMLAKTSVGMISGGFLYWRFICFANRALFCGDAKTTYFYTYVKV